jgi:hypothetical protein
MSRVRRERTSAEAASPACKISDGLILSGPVRGPPRHVTAGASYAPAVVAGVCRCRTRITALKPQARSRSTADPPKGHCRTCLPVRR